MNVNKPQHEIFLKVANVTSVYIAEDNKAYCDLEISDGTGRKKVPFTAGTFGTDTGNYGKPHGIFIAPIVGQMVGVMYAHGSTRDPIACFPIPHNWGGESDTAFDHKTVWGGTFSLDDIYIAHRSGAFVRLSTDGKAYINDLIIYPTPS